MLDTGELSPGGVPMVSHAGVRPATAVRTYVLDTSVLLSDPRALFRFAEHDVVLPIVVITELEGKRHHPELGFYARSALRLLDDLRIRFGHLDVPVPINRSWRRAACGTQPLRPGRPSDRVPAG